MASPKNTDRPDAARPTAQMISEPPDASLDDYISDGLLLDEDPDEFHAFSNDWWQELAPAGPIEFAIARTIIWLAWRIERVTRLESGLHIWNRYSMVGWSAHQFDEKEYRTRVAEATDTMYADRIANAPPQSRAGMRLQIQRGGHTNAERGLSARAWQVQSCDALERYQGRLERRLHRLLFELKRRRIHRGGPSPIGYFPAAD